MASPPQLDSEVSSDVDWTLQFDDYTTSEYGSPESSMTWSMDTYTEESPVTENSDDERILVSEEEEKEDETPEKAEESAIDNRKSRYLSMLIYQSSEESEDERCEENEAMRHAEARERVKRNLFGKPSKHRRRAGYGIEAEKAIKTLFRENINCGSIRTGEVRATRAAYPDISQHCEGFTDAQIKDKVWALIKKKINKKWISV